MVEIKDPKFAIMANGRGRWYGVCPNDGTKVSVIVGDDKVPADKLAELKRIREEYKKNRVSRKSKKSKMGGASRKSKMSKSSKRSKKSGGAQRKHKHSKHSKQSRKH